jgi:predicted peptidase
VRRQIQPPQHHPRAATFDRRQHLIVWLHGYGREEFDQIGYGHLRHTQHLFDAAGGLDRLDAFLLAVQCPVDQRAFFSRAPTTGDESGGAALPEPGEVTVRIIEQLLRERPIDAARVTLVGISGGGSACWEMAMRYPDDFAAVAPLASDGGDLTRVDQIVDIPVWAFHSDSDLDIPVEGVRETVEAFKAAGGNTHLTLIPGNDHDCWYWAFLDYDLLGWLLDQRKGTTSARLPGYVPPPWWQTVLSVSAPAIVVIAVALELRRRRVLHGRSA